MSWVRRRRGCGLVDADVVDFEADGEGGMRRVAAGLAADGLIEKNVDGTRGEWGDAGFGGFGDLSAVGALKGGWEAVILPRKVG